MPPTEPLFGHDPRLNLLPCDGQAYYHGPLLPDAVATRHFDALLASVPWQHDELTMRGRRVVTARQVAWIGDSRFAYTYSGVTHEASAWTPQLLELKALVEQHCGVTFNACLLNLYHSGLEGMGWHSDDESSLVPGAPIAGLSLGACRRFAFRHKRTGEKREVLLEHGSLVVMAGDTQRYWQHSVPKATRVHTARVSLTFRTMVGE